MYWFRGEMALMMVPSGRHAIPSHWKPGSLPAESEVHHDLHRGVRSGSP